MGKFLEYEKTQQTAFKLNSDNFSSLARNEGIYKEKPRPFCIPIEYARETLFKDIRQTALTYFKNHNIKWHDGMNGYPSNHLCDSQVCCVNFLFPFSHQPEALQTLLQPVFPMIKHMLPVDNGHYVTFEFIGGQNYLGERIRGKSKRTRGANFTSADAAFLFQQKDGAKRLVLIEWKYTESYTGVSLRFSKRGTDRTKIYSHLYRRSDCPLNKDLIPSFSALFYEPFYQLMRQQLLAHEIELAKEFNVDICSVLHVAPAQNKDYLKVTSPKLKILGKSVIDVWKKLIKDSDRFYSATTEKLFGLYDISEHHQLASWWEYITSRYSWIK
jgi:hypothetical protein